MNNLDKQYLSVLSQLLESGYTKKDRTGTGTLSLFNRHIRHQMSDGFPLLLSKKVHFPSIVTEFLWMMSGSNQLRDLLKVGNYIWLGDFYKRFSDKGGSLSRTEFVQRILTDDAFNEKWGSGGPIYGVQMRHSGSVAKEDQIKGVIQTLKENPQSRRIGINLWVPEDVGNMILPPCHYSCWFYTRELSLQERWKRAGEDWSETRMDKENIPRYALSLSWQQRSADWPLGVPFNLGFYGLFLQMVAQEVNMIPHELAGNFVNDCHIYLNQIEGAQEQIGRTPKGDLPQVEIEEEWSLENNKLPSREAFKLKNYNPLPPITYPLSN